MKPVLAAAALVLAFAACRNPPEPDRPAASAGPPDPCSGPGEAEPSELGDLPRSLPLAPGQAHAYALDFAPGEYLEVVADQDRIDLALVLFDEDGRRLLTADRLTGDAGRERLTWWSAGGGSVRVLACATGAAGDSGSYRIRIADRRPATAADRDTVAAARAFDVARGLEPDPETLEEAAAAYRRAAELWRKTGDERAGEALFLLAWLCDNRLGDPRAALDLYRRSLPYFDEPDAVEVRAHALYGLGHAHFQLGAIEASREAYEQALELYRGAALSGGEAVTSNNLGLVYELRGEVPEALDAFDRALRLWRELGNRYESAITLHNRGMAYLALGDGDRALDDLERALAIRRELGDPRREAATLTSIGLVHLQRDELDRAFEVHRLSLELRQASGDLHGTALSLNNLGETARRLEQPERALAYYREALPIFESVGDRRNLALLRHNLGYLLRARDPARAIAHFRRALATFDELGDRPARAWTLSGMAEAERRRGRLAEARELIEEALDEIESLRTRPLSGALRASFFAEQQWAYDVYVDLLMELHRRDPDAGHDREALTASERARARSQLDALVERGDVPDAALDGDVRRRLEDLQRSIRGLEEQRLRLLQEPAPEAQLAAVERRLRELVHRHERQWGEIRGTGGPDREALLTAAEIRDRIVDRDTLLLEYDLGGERSYLWAVTDREIASFELPGVAEIEDLGRRAYRLLTARHGRKWQAQTEIVLAALGELLLGPVADRLGGRRLAIVADGVLEYLPWGALPLPGGGGGLVADRHEVVAIPSASTLDKLRRNLAGRVPPPGVLAIFADPVFDAADPRVLEPDRATAERATAERFERLAHSRREAEAILGLLDAGDRRLAAFDFEAGRELAAGGELAGYRLLHFATHGEVDATHPQLSRLVFSRVDERGRPRPGFLFAHEIAGLDLPADLVVLSACRTALGREIRGEGLVGLTQSFFFAGAARVLVSLWNVDDRVTAELMSHFYRHLLQGGEKPATALRAAQVAIRKDPRWRSRYYWAGFVLKGEWR